VISALLLILLAVAAGIVAYTYVMGWLGGATKSPKAGYGQLQFDSIRADDSEDKIKMFVRNVGGVALNISKIYVDGEEKANNTALPDGGYEIDVNEVVYLEVNATVTKNRFYEVAVTCLDGTTVSQAVKGKK
jgi:hypothetical protein